MRLSASVEYALRATLCVAREPERTWSTRHIAQACHVPISASAGVLRLLARKRVLHACAGSGGRYRFVWDPQTVTLLQVMEAVGGPMFEDHCLLHGTPCPRDRWCPAHEVWEKAQAMFLSVFGRYSIGDVLERISCWDAIDQLLIDLTRELPSRTEPNG